MRSLRDVVQKVLDQKDKMGGVLSDSAIKALERHRDQLWRSFMFLEVVVLGVVIFGGYGVAKTIEDATTMAAFTGAIGITVGGSIELMRRVWREWSRMGLVLILLEAASEAQVESLLEQLKAKL